MTDRIDAYETEIRQWLREEGSLHLSGMVRHQGPRFDALRRMLKRGELVSDDITPPSGQETIIEVRLAT